MLNISCGVSDDTEKAIIVFHASWIVLDLFSSYNKDKESCVILYSGCRDDAFGSVTYPPG